MTDDELKNTNGEPDANSAEHSAAEDNAQPESPDTPTAENGPASAAPPRIVSEAPLGGVPRRVVPTPGDEFGAADEMAALDRALGMKSAAEDTDVDGSDILDDVPAEEPDASAHPTDPAGVFAEEKRVQRDAEPETPAGVTPEAASDEVTGTPAEGDKPTLPVPPPASATLAGKALTPEEQIKQRLKALQDAESGASTTSGATSPPSAEATSPAPAEPAPPPVESVGTASVDDWDDDVSPELASVLFGGKSAPEPATPASAVTPKAAPAEADSAQGEETTAAVAAEAEPEPKPEPEPDAAPVELTDIAEVRRIPITAEKRSAPAPDTTLDGKVRYVRVEEPLRNDEGQRTQETWDYLKPDYPGLAGRLVKEVSIEEISYADGSWLWRFERRYTDRGRDSREVRANPDRTYIERSDEVSKLDGESGRRLQFKEDAELIFAPPEKEEKRGLLSGLGSLLGRDDEDDESSAASEWRQATSSEARNARKQGGEALKRGFLGL